MASLRIFGGYHADSQPVAHVVLDIPATGRVRVHQWVNETWRHCTRCSHCNCKVLEPGEWVCVEFLGTRDRV